MQNVLNKLHIYLLEGVAIGLVVCVIPQRKVNLNELLMISLAGALTALILDLYSPQVGSAFRTGAGFGIGANHVGFGEGFQVLSDETIEKDLNMQDECEPGDEDCVDPDVEDEDEKENETNNEPFYDLRNTDFRINNKENKENKRNKKNNVENFQLNDDNEDDIDKFLSDSSDETASPEIKRIEEEFLLEYNNEAKGSKIEEAFQNPPANVSFGEQGLIYGQIIGNQEQSQKIHQIVYSGDVITVRDDINRYLTSNKDTELLTFNEEQTNENTLPKLRFQLYNQKNFEKLVPLNFGNIVKLVLTEGGKDKYVVADDNKQFTQSDDIKNTNNAFVLENTKDSEDNTAVNLNQEVFIKYVGSNAGPNDYLKISEEGYISVVAKSAADFFVLTECELFCNGPLWRHNR